jgi:diaminopropionate ammonia-lyase
MVKQQNLWSLRFEPHRAFVTDVVPNEARAHATFVNHRRDPDLQVPALDGRAFRFHTETDGYRPTRLRRAIGIERTLGAAEVWVKDESTRGGLPAFKVLGASWAIHLLMQSRELRAGDDVTLVAATDGNHGRAVARVAALVGLPARIYVPETIPDGRRAAILSEGAEVITLAAGYDEAIERAAADAERGDLVIADTSWPGYHEIPAWIVEGYGTLFAEVDMTLNDRRPDLVVIQIGVGSLAQAAVTWAHSRPGGEAATIVAVEPISAACAMLAVREGRVANVSGPHDSIMDCLHAGLSSLDAFPLLSAGIDLFVAIADGWAEQAVKELAGDGIRSTPTGAAGLAGLLALADSDADLSLAGRRILIVNTEGPDAMVGTG